MTSSKWDPFKDLLSIQERMNRIFEDTIARTKHPQDVLSTCTWSPAVDIFETKTDIVLRAELPGIEQGDIELEIQDNLLFLKGERKFQRDLKEENYFQVERSYGSFQRSFTLPSNVKKDNVKAVFLDGVLEVVIPKVLEKELKTIKVNITDQ